MLTTGDNYHRFVDSEKPDHAGGGNCCFAQTCLSAKAKERLEVAFLLTAIIFAVVLLSLMATFNYVLLNKEDSKKNDTGIANGSCNAEFSWGQISLHGHKCDAVSYTGSICNQILLDWSYCLGINSTVATLRTGWNESTIAEIQNLLENSGNSDCSISGSILLCQYVYPFYDCSSNRVFEASMEECIRISTDVCVSVWNSTSHLLTDSEQLNCSVLPSDATGSNLSSIPSTGAHQCSDGFYLENSTCLPQCDQWSMYSNDGTNIVQASRIIGTIIALIGGGSVLAGSIIRYKTMFVYPSIFLVYLTSSYCILVLFMGISTINRGLFCSSKNLIVSVAHPNGYCILTGIVSEYFILLMMIWWFLHVSACFHSVVFPDHARRFRSVLIPVPMTVVPLFHTDYNYTMDSFPPIFCLLSNEEFAYYAQVLPANILTSIGICMLIPTLWKVHKYHGNLNKKKGALNLNSTERKLLFVLSYYMIIFFSIYFSVCLARFNGNRIKDAIKENFECESNGKSDQCDRSEIEKATYSILVTLNWLLFDLLPLVNMVFVVNWTAARDKCHQCQGKWLKHHKSVFSSAANSSSATSAL